MTTAIVTGAAMGIGRATALRMAREGHRVLCLDVHEDGAATAKAIRDGGGEADFAPLDLRDGAAVTATIEAEISRSGAAEVVVANAGIALKTPLFEEGEAAWADVIDVNLSGAMRVVRAAAPAMRDARRGAVVCLSSMAGTSYGWTDHVAYCAAKAGILGMVRALAVDLAPFGIRANAIIPGLIRTAQSLDPVNSLGEDGLAAAVASIPLGRVGDPEDVADVIAFLASDQARYVTGHAIPVDGGHLVNF